MVFVSLLVFLDKEMESRSQFSLENSVIFFIQFLTVIRTFFPFMLKINTASAAAFLNT
jgi:hypothetical protein